MHTILVITGGLIGLAVILGICHFAKLSQPIKTGVNSFIPLWFIAAAVNMAVGVLHAGYTVMQELPMFLIVFGVPTIIALIIKKVFAKG